MPGKYQKFERPAYDRRLLWEVHPVWRGIGCFFLVLIPVMSYAGAVMLVEANVDQRWLPLSYDLMQPVAVPYVGSISHLYANLLVAALLALFGFALITALYALLDHLKGPSAYTALDAPMVRRAHRRR